MLCNQKNQERVSPSLGRVLTLVGVILLLAPRMGLAPLAQDDSAFVRQVRWIDSKDLDLSHPAGLAFSPAGNVFHVVEAQQLARSAGASSGIMTVTPIHGLIDRVPLLTPVTDPVNIAFDGKANRLLLYQSPTRQLVEIHAAPAGELEPTKVRRYDASQFDLQSPQGMTVDPATGQLFILDADGPAIVRIEPDADGGFKNGAIRRTDLAQTSLSGLRGLAFDPVSEHLYSMSAAEQTLYELTWSGNIVVSRDMSAFALKDPQGMVFAPSADPTDDPSLINLYIADSGLGDEEDDQSTLASTGRVIELSFAQLESPDAGAFEVSLVQTIDTWKFSPPGPDATGITYLESSGTLLISDSEVDEIPDLFEGYNLFEIDLSGNQIFTSTTTLFSSEPEGVSYNPDDGHLFFADDDDRSIYEMDPGADGHYGTGDDVITSFPTSRFGSYKPLGVAYSSDLGMLFIADCLGSEVYILTPGDNGVFDGVPPDGDDHWTSFDTTEFGVIELEGIAFNSENGLLYFVGIPHNIVAVTTIDGTLMHKIDISASNMTWPAGLTFGPSSLDPDVTHIYIADRGIDEAIDPDENDGKVYEMTLPPADTTPPVTSLTSAPPDPDNSSTPTFSFTGSDEPGGSGLVGFECRVDAGSWAACSSPHTTAPLNDGSHTFEVRAVDNFGNRDPSPASHTWTVDTTPPNTSLTSTPPDPDNDTTPTFSFTGSDPGGSGVVSFECRVGGDSWAACSSSHTTASLSDGTHTFEVRAIDNADNADPSPASYTWTIDTAPPDTALISTPPDPDNDNSPTFTFTGADEPAGSGLVGFECRLDGDSWATCSSPHTTPPLSDGTHTFQVRAVDDAGNRDPSPASRTWAVDTTPPDTSLTSAPPDPDGDSAAAFSFMGSDPGGSGVAFFQCQVDGTGWANCTSPYTTPGLSDGTHTFEVRAIDNADNADPSPASHTWTIDTAAPDTTLISTPPDPDNDTTAAFSFTGSDPGGSGVVSFECRVDGDSWATCSSPHTTASLSDGSHTFQVRAVDDAGNRDPTPASHTWTVDTTAPNTSLTSAPPDPDNDTAATFAFTGTNGAGSSVAGFECRLDGGSWAACTSPHTTAPLSDGPHTFEVRAVDTADNRDPTPASHTWTVDTTPPNTSLTSTPPDPDNDTAPTFSFTGSDPGGSGVVSFECRVDGDSWAACSSPHTTASLSDGSHTFQVRAVDDAGNPDPSPASYTWTIDTAPPDTTLTSAPPDPDNDNTPTFFFTGSDSGSGVAGFECRLDGGSWAACSSPHTTAPLSDGTHTFEVRAVDNFSNRDPSPASYTWTVDTTRRIYLPLIRG